MIPRPLIWCAWPLLTRALGAQITSPDGAWTALMATPTAAFAPQVVGEGLFASRTFVGARLATWARDGRSQNYVVGASFYRRGRSDVGGVTLAMLRPGCDCPSVPMVGLEWIAMHRRGWRRETWSVDAGFRSVAGYGVDREDRYFSFGVSLPLLIGGFDVAGMRVAGLLEPGGGFGKTAGSSSSDPVLLKTFGGGVAATTARGHRVTLSGGRVFVDDGATTLGVAVMWRLDE